MELRAMKDQELLKTIKTFVQDERTALMMVLAHLREIERRRLYADLGFKSLFEYAVRELAYSEDQAARRIQAMRLIVDVPEVEAKIADGTLSLSNAHQAQTLFKSMPEISMAEKLGVVASIENKSRREAERELIKWQPQAALPKERERVVAEDIAEVRFLLTDKLKAKLENVRALLGPAGAAMGYAELFDAMSDLAVGALEKKRFGKKRVESVPASRETKAAPRTISQNPRYISQAIKHAVWRRDGGQCCQCRGQRNLNYDHVRPVALGGKSELDNLRLLCFGCNQRASVKTFGIHPGRAG